VRELRTTRHSVYQTAYHIVWIPKYRRAILTGPVVERTRTVLEEVARRYDWPLPALEVQPDHLHLFLSIPPTVAVSKAVKLLKGISARKLLVEFPQLRRLVRKNDLWAPSYYVGSAGQVSADTIRHYIERAEHIRTRT
jgi:putative transposase